MTQRLDIEAGAHAEHVAARQHHLDAACTVARLGARRAATQTSVTGADWLAVAGEIPPEPAHDAGRACPACNGDVPRPPDAEDLASAPDTFMADPGGCVDFHKPNRTLEEFDFFSVVRTTEPVIRGLTLTEPARLPVAVILKTVSPKLLPLLQRKWQYGSRKRESL